MGPILLRVLPGNSCCPTNGVAKRMLLPARRRCLTDTVAQVTALPNVYRCLSDRVAKRKALPWLHDAVAKAPSEKATGQLLPGNAGGIDLLLLDAA
ncbi:MAG: hypothetical protein ACFB10_18930 [Salibacteraceae bacterium]